MAQLNDLLVLGKSSLLGELKVNSDITAPQLILETSSGEGGQIQLKPALNDLTNSGIVIDTANGAFRIFGLPSRNGSTRTGNGTVLTIDPYAKTISGGYSFDGVSARTQKIETWQSDKSKTYGASYPLYAWWETNSECRLTVDNYTVKVNYADTSGLANSVAWGNVTGKPSSYPPSSHTHDFITYKDTRNNNQTPDDLQAGVTIHLKANGTDGLNDGGSYHPILAFKDWGDYSGGPYGQITTTANQNLYFRSSTSGTAWGSWYKVAIQNKDNTFSGYNTFSNRITQGSPSTDTTIANMNRFQTDLFVQGNGSAPNSPKVAGFYLGKSTSDENRHMDIVSGGDYSYIDFNKASVVEDYKTRLIVNVSTGLTEFNWNSASNPQLNINGRLVISSTADTEAGSASGALRIGNVSGEHLSLDGNEIMAKSSATAASTLYLNNEGGIVQTSGDGLNVGGCYIRTNNVSSYGGLRIYGNLVGGYEGIHLGSSASGMTIMNIDGSHQGLYQQSTGTWIVYHLNGNVGIGTSGLTSGYKVTLGGATSIVGELQMNNSGITGVNSLTFADPGAQEGITWTGGNGWWIYESPDNLTNAAGNLQFVHGSTRRLTINTDGYVDINARLVVRGNGSSYNEGIRILPASNGWSNIFFSADTSLSGTHDGGWLIGRRGAVGSVSGAVGDFTIEEQESSGVNLTIHKDSNGATLQGLMRSTAGFQVQRTAGDGYGLGLYGSSGHNQYGIHMSRTANCGTFGHVSSDWATYFCFDGDVNRGWIFKHAGNNVFSINGSGTLSTRVNIPAINFRAESATYYTTVSHQTAGNEALVFAAKNAVTSFIFVNGEDGVTNNASDRWYSLTPGLQIKNNCVAIGKLIASGTNPTYKLEVAGTSYFTGKMQVNAPIFGYNYTNNNNAAAFMWDKIGTNYTGVGANGVRDTIYFGACNADGTWIPSYKQKWVFNGAVSADTVAGAVWNDYAEYRDQIETIEPGYCVASTNSGKIYKTTEKFQTCDGIVSDTFGFAIGQTEESKTPLAVAGRVLAYCEGNRYDYNAGDTVCAGPDGKVCKMTRDEIKEYPDRIIGHVSEIPEYEIWGTGNVQVNGRIWIKIK